MAGLTPEQRLPLDAADVPLQRLVLPVGGDRGGRAARDRARRSTPGRVWELIESEGVTHYNGAPTVHIGVVSHPVGAPRWSGR